ncbi:MAG: TrkH family potassium uptake protein [Clostridiales bacterium]|nr:TrkH family potassium uptake protein [Clostridiales bacterium]
MNYRLIIRMIGRILQIEAIFMIPALLIAMFSGESAAVSGIGMSMLLCLITGTSIGMIESKNSRFYAREGFVTVGLAWLVVSLAGALPFYISGAIPSFVDSFFETVSGFTTTGASILTDVEALPNGLLYWRSFTHWLGGMGVLVFALAITPRSGDSSHSMLYLKAESPGPKISKLVPKTRRSAGILYAIYVVLTVLQFVLLLFDGMPALDAITLAFGTAGTGGFAIRNTSVAAYSHYAQTVVTVFMILFGVNFSVYYMLLVRMFRRAARDEELRVYLLIVVCATLIIAANIYSELGSVYESIHQSAFQVASIITTTGFATVDFDKWPEVARYILLLLMVCGACAGSTGGGIKVSRVIMLFKKAKHSVYQMMHPDSVHVMHISGERVDDDVIRNVDTFMTVYIIIGALTVLFLSLDGFSFETNFSAMLACLNNIGPGLGVVGPAGNFSQYSDFNKILLSANMLIGRLEIFPFLALFTPAIWKK